MVNAVTPTEQLVCQALVADGMYCADQGIDDTHAYMAPIANALLRNDLSDSAMASLGRELVQQFLAIVHCEVQYNARITPGEFGQQARKEVVARTDHRDIQLAARDAFQLAHRLVDFVELLNDSAAVVQHFRAGRREVDLFAELLEERQSGVLLQLANLCGHRGLREMQLLGGAREAQVARHGFEHLQLTQRGIAHRHGRCISKYEST